ncbi:hypothetical protein PVA44_02800 [Entomospira nematocerorum]|uniref:HEAT repeat domain-containing protein n=1 Tax=Entomospira nematocerorum TaxID=2719987 RepID=A0A968GFW1_9SPIO|nr:hypothetical protein [Entomospira nematocera]NIZ47036.1 hypothetical protein [Entomospira nematocera]WDI34419.1 hypothetical protein PVA44_02800 [Entomospira nematocera]
MQVYLRLFFIISMTTLYYGCISTKSINLSAYGSLFHHERSLDVRELEASRILKINIHRIEVRPDDITRLQNLLQTNTLFVPIDTEQSRTDTSDLTPLGSPRQYKPSDNKDISLASLPISEREAYVRSLEIQAVIRLLSRDYSRRTFLLILEQLTNPFEHVQNEVFDYIMQADATYERYIWDILQSGRLSQPIRARLIPFFLKIGDRGIIRLLILLEDNDPIIVDAVVQTLITLYPNYDNPQLNLMVESPYYRHWAPAWLFAYEDPNAFQLAISLADDPNPLIANATRQALLSSRSDWLLQQAEQSLQENQSFQVRQLLIEYLVRFLHPAALYYVHELLLSEEPNIRTYADRYIRNSDSAYYPYLVQHLTNPETSEELLIALLPYSIQFQKLSMAEVILPLLNHSNDKITNQVKIFFETTYNQNNIQKLLLQYYFDHLNPNTITLFIMNLFISHNNTLILTPNAKIETINSTSFAFLLHHIPAQTWPIFISHIRPTPLQVYINQIYTLFIQLQKFTQFSEQNNILISSAYTLIHHQATFNTQQIKQKSTLSNLISVHGSDVDFYVLQEKRQARDTSFSTLRELVARQKNTPDYTELVKYHALLQEITRMFLTIRVEHRSFAIELLEKNSITEQWLASASILKEVL